MAIVTETFRVGERDFVRTYSDRGMLIHGGMPEADYEEGLDPAELGRTYVETDIPIGGSEEVGDADKAEAYDILTGERE